MIEGMPFTFYDLMALGAVLFIGLFAAIWGFVGMIGTLGAWVGAGVFTLFFYPKAQILVINFLDEGLLADITAGVGSFAIALLVLMLIGTMLSKWVKSSTLGPANRALGMALGLGLGYSIVALIMASSFLLMGADGLPQALKDSRSYGLFTDSGMRIFTLVPDQMKSDGLMRVEQERAKASDMMDAYQLYQRYIAPTPNTQEMDAKQDQSLYNDQDKINLDRLIQASE